MRFLNKPADHRQRPGHPKAHPPRTDTPNSTARQITIRPLRRPGKDPIQRNTNRTSNVPSMAALALNKMGFGPKPGDFAAFDALGNTDEARLFAYIETQLDLDNIDDSDLNARLAQINFETVNKTRTQLWTQNYRDPEWEVVSLPVKEAEAVKFQRAIYSNAQFYERMVEFWHDHFSVYAWDEVGWSMFMNYDQNVIRPNTFGNFYDMLLGVAQSATMGWYLDNVFSSADGPNENYARELLELHTMGAENYLGNMAPEDVPGYPNNVVGYVENDVFEIARCLTGWTMRWQPWNSNIGDSGAFLFYEPYHDSGTKQALGMAIPANQGMQDGVDVLTKLARHPGTAAFVCRKLCRRLVADFPPQTLVDSAAAVFLANVDEPDQLKHVYRHILQSAEFRASWGGKLKRPFDALISAMRAGGFDFNFDLNHDQTGWIYWEFDDAGHSPFAWHPPNGYPDLKPIWQGSASLLMRLRIMNWLTSFQDEINGDYFMDVFGQHDMTQKTATEIVDYWIDRIFGYTIDTHTRDELIDFMAQGYNPTFDLPIATDEDTQSRIRSLVGLIFMSPDFQWR